MAWLLQGALPLLLLAVSGHAMKSLELEFEEFDIVTSVDGLINYEKDVTVGFLNEILVTKYCFRDWVDDAECNIHAYEAAVQNSSISSKQAEEQNPEGHDADMRIKKQMKEITDHIATIDEDAEQKFLNTLGQALQRNLKEMVKGIMNLDALNSHLNSTEFREMFGNISLEISKTNTNEASHTTTEAMKHEVARVVYSQWLQDERDKMFKGALDAFNQRNMGTHKESKDKWLAAMNKIPETLKYRTRGATPFVKKHLADKFKAMDSEKYEELKDKSQAYLQKIANQMRHEAMAKSDSIISLVIHSKDHGEMMKKLDEMVRDRKPKMNMNHKNHGK